MQKHIGPYQRPAPPKKPLGLGSKKSVQKPAVPMHEIEAKTKALFGDMVQKARKPGRPSINEQPMTPAERQARRRAFQSQARATESKERAIKEVQQIGAAHGKSHAEAKSGGYDYRKLDAMQGLRDFEGLDDHGGGGWGRHVRAAEGESSAAHEQTTDEILNSGEASAHRGGFEGHEVQKIHVSGLQIGDEGSNRRRFAEDELKKMVGKYFTSPESTPSASWIAKHAGNVSIQNHVRPSINLTCKLCPDSMDSVEDAQDHLRVDHRKAIDEWFARLIPRREFRDMRSFVTVALPKDPKNCLKSDS